jgi:hypothetical protein
VRAMLKAIAVVALLGTIFACFRSRRLGEMWRMEDIGHSFLGVPSRRLVSGRKRQA